MEQTVETSATPVIDQEAVEKFTKELEDFQASLKNKVYPVRVETEETLKELVEFIETEAQWKNMEALGIIEVSKALRAESVKSGNVFLESLPIQAISFFLSKTEGFGLRAATKHIKFVKPVDEALKLIKLDNDNLNRIQSELAAAENGITVDK